MTPRQLAKLLASLGSAVLVAVLVVAVWVVRHRTAAQLLKEAASVVPGSLLSARNFHWTEMKGDHKQWELVAREASFSDDRKSLRLTDAFVSMTANDGKRLTVRAPRADLALVENHVKKALLSGGLELDYEDLVVTASEAAFSPDSDELDVPGPVTIEGRGFKVSGTGLTAHPRAQVFDLHAQVSTEVIPRARAAQASVAKGGRRS